MEVDPVPQRLHPRQIEVLLRPIKPQRVGKTPQGFAHVEAWDIRAMLIRIFGFAGWSLIETSPPVCVFERERKLSSGKDGVSVAYRAHLAIVIHLADGDVTYAGSAIAEAVNQIQNVGDAHDQALKSAESGALKRAATNLGDQFGLSLYDDGSLKPVVMRVVGYNDDESAGATAVAPAARPTPVPDAGSAPEDSVPPVPSGDGRFQDAFDRLTAREKVLLARAGLDQTPPIRDIYKPDGESEARLLVLMEDLVAAREP